MPAIIESKDFVEYYSAEDGYIEEILFSSGENVKKGQLLLKIKSPQLEFRIAQIEKEITQIKLEINRQAGFKESLNKRFIQEENLLKKENELEGLNKIINKLVIKADIDGKIYFNDTFKVNQWINKKEPIFTLYDNLNYKIVAFCNENDFRLLKENSHSKFIFDSGDIKNIYTKITNISKVSVPYLEFPELSSDYGGSIATRQDRDKGIKTQQAYYKISIDLNDENQIDLKNRKSGVLITKGENSSIISEVFRKVVSVLIRESDF